MTKQKEEKKSLGVEMYELQKAMGDLSRGSFVVEVLERQMKVLEHLVELVEETKGNRFDLI